MVSSVLLGALLAPWFGQEIDLASVGIYALLGLGPLLFVVSFLRAMSIERVGHHAATELQGA